MRFILLLALISSATWASGQVYLSPVYHINPGVYGEDFANHAGLRAGYRGSFMKSRWRADVSGVIGKIDQGLPEQRSQTLDLTTITTRTDYLWFGINAAFDFSLIQEASSPIQPFLGFGLGIYNYSYEEQIRFENLGNVLPGQVEPLEVVLGAFLVSGRAGIEYELAPSMRIAATYSYHRFGDPEVGDVFSPLNFTSHEIGLGFVYHFGYSNKKF